MKMGVKVYYAEISGHQEVKKHQQRVMMILQSKLIPFEAIDITEAGKEADKEFMLKNAKPRGDSKFILSPQIFNEEVYCGDYEDFDMANENDILEKFLNTPKVERHASHNGAQNGTGSRESSAETELKNVVADVKVDDSPKPTIQSTSTEAETTSSVETVETNVSNTTATGPSASSLTESDPAPHDDDLGLGDEVSPENDESESKKE